MSEIWLRILEFICTAFPPATSCASWTFMIATHIVSQFPSPRQTLLKGFILDFLRTSLSHHPPLYPLTDPFYITLPSSFQICLFTSILWSTPYPNLFFHPFPHFSVWTWWTSNPSLFAPGAIFEGPCYASFPGAPFLSTVHFNHLPQLRHLRQRPPGNSLT